MQYNKFSGRLHIPANIKQSVTKLDKLLQGKTTNFKVETFDVEDID